MVAVFIERALELHDGGGWLKSTPRRSAVTLYILLHIIITSFEYWQCSSLLVFYDGLWHCFVSSCFYPAIGIFSFAVLFLYSWNIERMAITLTLEVLQPWKVPVNNCHYWAVYGRASQPPISFIGISLLVLIFIQVQSVINMFPWGAISTCSPLYWNYLQSNTS